MKTPVINQVTIVCFLAKLQYTTGLLKYLLLLFILNGPVMQAQVGVHTDFPDASSAMDIYATNRGLLIPRVSLSVDLGNPSPITSPAVGLLVFNSGANQPMGFYYWDGSLWVSTSGIAGNDYWLLKGNSGTEAGTNYIGTNDNEDFVIFTNEAERMRVEADGQVVIDSAGARYSNDVFTVFGNSNQNSAINAYKSSIGVYTESGYAGFYSSGGQYGLISLVNSDSTNAIYSRNTNASGYGILTGGAGAPLYTLNGSYTGIASTGGDGVFAYGIDATGTGVIAVGSAGDTAFLIPEGAGGAFTGYHGSYSRARNTSGTGVIGGGNYGPAYTITGGSGGAFTGVHGLISTATNSSTGTGVIGIGNNGSYYLFTSGSGGAFTGNNCGVAAWGTQTNSYGGMFSGHHGNISYGTNATGTGVIAAGNNITPNVSSSGSGGAFTGTSYGVIGYGTQTNSYGGQFSGHFGSYSKGTNASAGIGVIGVGNNGTGYTIPNGCGGEFVGYHGSVSIGSNVTVGTGVIGLGNNYTTISNLPTGSGGYFVGYHGVYGKGNNGTVGTGIVGVGNNLATINYYSNGSGGAFKGVSAGAVGWATTVATGTGVLGAGNNITAFTLYPNGSGGAFVGTYCGAAGYANTPGSTSYGLYGRYNGSGNNHGTGVYGYSAPAADYGYGVQGYGNKYGVLGVQGTTGASNYGVYANGNLACSGTKTFAIDHPLDPENKILRHFDIESPEVLNMYRGNIVLDENGVAEITLPDYFSAININFSYDLTPIGQPAPNLFINEEINNEGKFSIAGGNPGQKISWVVYAERNDLYMRQEGIRAVEIEKDDHEKGRYFMPELYNQPPEKGIFYTEANRDVITVSTEIIIADSELSVLEIDEKTLSIQTGQDSLRVQTLEQESVKGLIVPAKEIPHQDKSFKINNN